MVLLLFRIFAFLFVNTLNISNTLRGGKKKPFVQLQSQEDKNFHVARDSRARTDCVLPFLRERSDWQSRPHFPPYASCSSINTRQMQRSARVSEGVRSSRDNLARDGALNCSLSALIRSSLSSLLYYLVASITVTGLRLHSTLGYEVVGLRFTITARYARTRRMMNKLE